MLHLPIAFGEKEPGWAIHLFSVSWHFSDTEDPDQHGPWEAGDWDQGPHACGKHLILYAQMLWVYMNLGPLTTNNCLTFSETCGLSNVGMAEGVWQRILRHSSLLLVSWLPHFTSGYDYWKMEVGEGQVEMGYRCLLGVCTLSRNIPYVFRAWIPSCGPQRRLWSCVVWTQDHSSHEPKLAGCGHVPGLT